MSLIDPGQEWGRMEGEREEVKTLMGKIVASYLDREFKQRSPVYGTTELPERCHQTPTMEHRFQFFLLLCPELGEDGEELTLPRKMTMLMWMLV